MKVGNNWVNSVGELVALKWAPGQPSTTDDNGVAKNCLTFPAYDNAEWYGKINDIKCTHKMHTVCETIYL